LVIDNATTLSLRRLLLTVPLTLGATLVAIYTGLGLPCRQELRRAWPVVVVVAAFSWLPTMIVPSALIVDAVMFYLMLFLLYLAYVHVAAWRFVRQSW